MTVTKSQNLVHLEDSIAETKLVAIVNREPAEIGKLHQIEFRPSFDDLDYLVFASLSLPSGDRISLIRHDNSPTPGIEICVKPALSNISVVLKQAMAEMNFTIDYLTWIHPEYEQQVRDSLISESEIEANALTDPDNQPLTPDSLKKVRRIKRK
ncbi:MAG: hypothetical protein AAFR62_04075 [Cyanobacteria bacterium J06629_2]